MRVAGKGCRPWLCQRQLQPAGGAMWVELSANFFSNLFRQTCFAGGFLAQHTRVTRILRFYSITRVLIYFPDSILNSSASTALRSLALRQCSSLAAFRGNRQPCTGQVSQRHFPFVSDGHIYLGIQSISFGSSCFFTLSGLPTNIYVLSSFILLYIS